MKLFWEYTFPITSPILRITMQKGRKDLLGVAVAQLFSHPQSARTTLASLFEIDLKRKQVLASSTSIIIPGSFIPMSLQMAYDRERARWLYALDQTVQASCILEIYEVDPRGDVQWLRQACIEGERRRWTFGDMRCHALWKTGKTVSCVFTRRAQAQTCLFWATWDLQNDDWNEELHRIEKGVVITTYVHEQQCLLFLRERLLNPHGSLPGTLQVSCLAYGINGERLHQEILPQLTEPIRSRQDPDEDFGLELVREPGPDLGHVRSTFIPDEDVWQEIGVASGPLYRHEQQPTCILAEETHTKGERPQVITSHLFWLDLQGHVLESLDGPLGRHLTLCCCGEKVIGTDLFEGQWRRWHWVPSAGTGIQVDAYLSAEVTQSIVIAEEPQPDQKISYYWCIEGYELGIRVSQRESEGGNELMVAWCEDFLLLSDCAKAPSTKPHQIAVVSDGCLVLLGVDEDEQLKLVCFQ